MNGFTKFLSHAVLAYVQLSGAVYFFVWMDTWSLWNSDYFHPADSIPFFALVQLPSLILFIAVLCVSVIIYFAYPHDWVFDRLNNS